MLPKPLRQFSDKELSAFGQRGGSAPENMLVKAVDPDGTRFKNGKYPWYQCPTFDNCFTKLFDDKDPMTHMIIFEVSLTTSTYFDHWKNDTNRVDFVTARGSVYYS